MLEICNGLFSEWNNSKVMYCHWKSNEHLDAGLDGLTDLDVLISPASYGKGVEILYNLDFLKCKSQFGSRYPDVEDWLGFDKNTGSLIHVHLHQNLVTGHTGMKEYNLPWTKDALETRILDSGSGVYVMEPNLEFLTLYSRIGLKVSFRSLIKMALGTYRISKDTKREIDWLRLRVDWHKVEGLVEHYFGKYSKSVLQMMDSDTLGSKQVKELMHICESNFEKDCRVKSHRRIKEIYYFTTVKYVNRWRRKLNRVVILKKIPETHGLSIAFMGQDGAGKTTVTNDIRKWLSWKLDVNYSYLGSGDNYSSLLKTVVHLTPRVGPFGYIKKLLGEWMYYGLSKDVLSAVKRGKAYAKAGGVQIFDRFPQTEYAGINDGPKIRSMAGNQRFLGGIVSFLADIEEENLKRVYEYQPDVVFKLLISPEESVRRKHENTLEEMELKHNIVKSIKFPNACVYEIDASKPYCEEILEIKSKIWLHILKS